MRKYRDQVEIIADILVAASEGCCKTNIMYRANLSSPLLRKYLLILDETNPKLLTKEGGIYTTTEDGKKFVTRYENYKEKKSQADKAIEATLEIRAELEEMILKKQ